MTNENWGPALRQLHIVLNAGALGTLADANLLERFVLGRGDADSSAAFAAILERHGPMVLGVCRDVLRDMHDAEDASQATFLVLAKKAGSIRRGDSLASWLFGVAMRVAAKARSEAARRRAIERRGSEMNARSGDESTRAIPCPELYEELQRLPERYRAPIVLCHLEGLTNEQAAGELALPVRTVQRRLAQGRERLRARLVRRGCDRADGVMGCGFAALAPAELWLEATVRAASGLAAGREISAVASVTVTALTQGVLTMMLIGRLKIVAGAVMAAGAVIVAVVVAGAAIASRRQAEAAAQNAEVRQVASKVGVMKAADTPFARVGPWIKGMVVDTSGKPVGGARVSAYWSIDPVAVTTKADGVFAIATNETRLVNQAFLATADNGARQGIFRFDGPTGKKDPRALVRIVLKPARAVTVSVVDGRGAAVEGAAVSLDDMVFPVAEGRTDARGIATLRAPEDALTQWIFAYKAGVGFDYFENSRTIPAGFSPPPERANLVLNGTRTVRVRAVDSAGGPVPGVEVVPVTVLKKGKINAVNVSASSAKARTDARGVATFDWFPADLMAGTAFLVTTASYSVPKWAVLETDKPDAEVTLRVQRLTRVTGKVAKPDGSPAAGVLIVAEGAGSAYPPGSGRARTAADGSYAMDLPPDQSYMVCVDDDEWAARSRTGVVVRDGQLQTGVDLRLERGSVIRGRVTAGKDSRPALGLAVMLFEQGPAVPKGTFKEQLAELYQSSSRIADTDADGRYAFRVAPGAYQLIGPREREADPVSERLKVGPGQEIEKNFRLARLDQPWRIIRGVVRSNDANGSLIPGAIVVAEAIGVRSPPIRGFADDKGHFEFPRIFGRSLIYARDSGGNLAGYATLADDDVTEVVIVARPAAIARGRVVDSSGKPRVGMQVYYASLLHIAFPDALAGESQSVETDEQGRFSALGLLVGAQCNLSASDPAGGNSRDHTFDVKDTKTLELGDIVLDPRGAGGNGARPR